MSIFCTLLAQESFWISFQLLSPCCATNPTPGSGGDGVHMISILFHTASPPPGGPGSSHVLDKPPP